MRPLDENERALLAVLLSGDGPRLIELRAQVPAVSVVAPWSPGWPSLHLAVGSGVARSAVGNGPAASGWAYGPTGDPLGTLLVWVTDGYLSGLEYGWVTDEPPAQLPAATSVQPD